MSHSEDAGRQQIFHKAASTNCYTQKHTVRVTQGVVRLYRQSSSLSIWSVVLREGNRVIDHPEQPSVLRWRDEVTKALPTHTHGRTQVWISLCAVCLMLFSPGIRKEVSVCTGGFSGSQNESDASIVCFYNSQNLLVSGNLKIQRSVFCALLYSHHYRQDGAVILQIDHSYCYWGDVPQLLAKRLAGAGQHWRKSCEQRNKGSKKETFNVILQMIQNTWCHTGRFSKWGRRRLTGELECLHVHKIDQQLETILPFSANSAGPAATDGLRNSASLPTCHDVKPASSTIKAERKHSKEMMLKWMWW